MKHHDPHTPPSRSTPKSHHRGREKLARTGVVVDQTAPILRKPQWIRIRPLLGKKIRQMQQLLRQQAVHTVCEESACPNSTECFQRGVASFMILGDRCTRRCPFCDVAHGQPLPPDPKEPAQVADTIQALGLSFAVITSANRDDLADGGAAHYVAVINAIRQTAPKCQIEILTPDFRGRQEKALLVLAQSPPDIFNHNLETVPRLYHSVRPGADYAQSLKLLRQIKQQHPAMTTKSGLMLGLGERLDEVESVMRDLRDHGCEMLTLGQYLQPSREHLPVKRYLPPKEFDRLGQLAKKMGFQQIASGPMVRSSYQADLLHHNDKSDA